jgi:hypothetical protein
VFDFTGGAEEDFSVTSFCDKGRNQGRKKTLLDHQFLRFVFPRSFLQCVAFFPSVCRSSVYFVVFALRLQYGVACKLPRRGEMMTESIFGLEN